MPAELRLSQVAARRRVVDVACAVVGCMLLVVGAVTLGATSLGLPLASPLIGDAEVAHSVQSASWFHLRRAAVALGCVLVAGWPRAGWDLRWSPRFLVAGVVLVGAWLPVQAFTLALAYDTARCDPGTACSYVPVGALLVAVGLPVLMTGLTLALCSLRRAGWTWWRAVLPAVVWLASSYGQQGLWVPDLVERMW